MYFIFNTTGRLGNAIFRYFACSLLCILYDGEYKEEYLGPENKEECDDFLFNSICDSLSLNDNKYLKIFENKKYIWVKYFYQHDKIYRKYKKNIIEFSNKNPEHYILTDGITAGDMKCEKFYMKDILKAPEYFNKFYENVLHIRLEDFVTHNLYIPKERIIELLKKNVIDDKICIVCKKPETKFEIEYIDYIKEFLIKKNISVIIENNDTLTDFHILKQAKILICSKSTLSWAAAFLSDNLLKCYFPDYNIHEAHMTFKYPIDDTEFY